jgi:site-specific DNA recombinase
LRTGAADVVIAYAVDRLSRNQNQIGVIFDEIQQAGARLEFVTERFEDTAVGRFILAARAFVGEVEREEMGERTTRGKLERARTGRIPQAFGRGCYGYVSNPATGQRDIEPFQAEVVRRIFTRFTELRSFDRVSHELNQDGITAFDGGIWFPIGVKRVLRNESCTARLIYRRTRWNKVRGKDGKVRRKQVARSPEEWVEIPGASPRIVDAALWQRVQQIIDDPERIARRPKPRHAYPLRGRDKCLLCGSAMVGQTMINRGQAHHYYVCRVAFDRRTGRTCSRRNVRADRVEAAIWREIRAKLTSPEIILQELRRGQPEPDRNEIARIEDRLSEIGEQERRLVKHLASGRIDERLVVDELDELKRQRTTVQERLRELQPPDSGPSAVHDADLCIRACRAVGDFLDKAGPEDRTLALEALQIAIRATPTEATVHGVVPVDSDVYCLANDHANACCSVIHRPAPVSHSGSRSTSPVSARSRRRGLPRFDFGPLLRDGHGPLIGAWRAEGYHARGARAWDERGRGSSPQKTEIVLRVLWAENLGALSRGLGVAARSDRVVA